MIAAALQFRPAFLDVGANLATLGRWLDAVEADLVVLPELCTTGYFFHETDQLRTVAEPRDGQTVAFLRGVAADRGIVIVAGFAERDGEALYNSAATVFPDGRVEIYRKVHLFAEEKIHFTPGNLGFPVAHWGDRLRLGVMICYDWRFPEAARTLALRGAQVIAHPSALVAAPRLWQPVMRTRSFENRVFTMTANRTGVERRGDDELVFHGCSQIVAPNGSVLAEAGEVDEGWIVSRIDPARADEKAFSSWNDIITDRRPESYAL
ncbi:MAG: nitrilase-related carbon-nitrogen hydrolase [Bacteroidota bacterium]|jgi:predicted amidohydrolase|nr:nitrilase-related carbon-nitrogen hydrolase [Bacteroidota bacterium]